MSLLRLIFYKGRQGIPKPALPGNDCRQNLSKSWKPGILPFISGFSIPTHCHDTENPYHVGPWAAIGIGRVCFYPCQQRRHLNESQRDMVGARIANLTEGRPSITASIEAVSETRAAGLMNTSRSGIQRAKKVISQGAPELIKAVDAGKIAVSLAEKTTELSQEKQTKFVEAVNEGKKP